MPTTNSKFARLTGSVAAMLIAAGFGLASANAASFKINDISANVQQAAAPIVKVAGEVNGASVKRVFHAGGRFVDKGNGKWEERGNDGAKFDFRETGRDEWSVYLTDDSRGVNLQLDLHRKMIFYSDANTPQRPQYEITKAEAGKSGGSSATPTPSAVNGRNVKNVKYEGGSFRQKKDGSWIEKNNDGKHNFVETGRDDWSVYLEDKSRNVNIQLDLHRKEIFYSDANTPKRVQYLITDSK